MEWVSLIGTVIAGLCTIIGVVITNSIGNSKMQHRLEMAQAITDTKLQTLTDEVRAHNAFAVRIPLIESKIERIEKQIERDK